MEPSDPGITMLEVDMEDLLSEKCKNTPNFATNARRVRFDMSEPPATRSATKSGCRAAAQRAKAKEKEKQFELGSKALREAQKHKEAKLKEMSREDLRVRVCKNTMQNYLSRQSTNYRLGQYGGYIRSNKAYRHQISLRQVIGSCWES